MGRPAPAAAAPIGAAVRLAGPAPVCAAAPAPVRGATPARGAALSALLLAAWLGAAAGAGAQRVALSGSMGADKALLLIDGMPQMLTVGASARGVTLRSLHDGVAEVEVGGRLQLLRLGGAPSRIGGAGEAGGGSEIVLPMGPGGHFSGQGAINGKSVSFLVDTGATTVALSQSEANRIGLDWKRGRPGLTNTANGTVPVYSINLSSVRLGSVEIANVAAVVIPSDMPTVLLGNSFLNRFTMRRDSDVMRLEKKN